MEKSNTYCIMPYISLALQNDGDICACNVNPMSYQDNKREVMFIHKDSIKDAWKSHTKKILQQSLSAGIRLPQCKHCWDLEDTGSPSPRTVYNESFSEIKPNPDQPRVFVLKPGNTCNLSCRMCNPATSSSWYKDAHRMAVQREEFTGTLKDYTKNFESIRNSFSRDNNFWNDFVEWLPNLEFLDVYGGEPFLINGLFDSIRKVGQDNLHDVSIQFHTNAQKVNEEYLELLKGFKKVYIGLSIDSHIPEQMEYIRNGCQADVVYENSKKIIDFCNENDNIECMITLTVTTLNIYYLDEIIDNLEKNFNIKIGLNFVTGPDEEYDIRHIPMPVREIIAEKMQGKDKCEQAINFLMQTIPGCDIIWPKFWKTTKMLDGIRNQSFERTFPEYYQLLKDYL